MTIEFIQTTQDIIELNYHCHWSAPGKKESRFVNSVLPLSGFILLIFLNKGIAFEKYGIAEYLILSIGVFCLFSMSWMTKLYIKRKAIGVINSGKNTDLLGTRTYVLDEERFIEITASSKAEILWTAFENITETQDYFFLFNHVNSAYILPKRVFENQKEIESFRNIASNRDVLK
ncbi:MAG: hypothetical protein JWP69_983 [Flaviaesturariibacter sp.]|nr:hypothetical protein [Flaviaesturariibacter sp.]